MYMQVSPDIQRLVYEVVNSQVVETEDMDLVRHILCAILNVYPCIYVCMHRSLLHCSII